MDLSLEATVGGPPPSMGSKRAFVNRRSGAAIIVDQNVLELRRWQDAMRAAMREACPLPEQVSVARIGIDAVGFEALGPWFASITVVLPRPRSHYGKKGTITKSARRFPTVKPDPDKIARAVFDCGSGIWWVDDKQIVSFAVRKRYADQDSQPIGVTIVAGPIPPGEELYFLPERIPLKGASPCLSRSSSGTARSTASRPSRERARRRRLSCSP